MNRDAAARIEIMNYALGGVATLVALAICTQPQVLGLFVGALLGALNFSAVKRLVGVQLDAQKKGHSPRRALLVLPKMLALALAMGLAVFLLPISVPFLALGFSIFMLSIGIETLRFITNPGNGSESHG